MGKYLELFKGSFDKSINEKTSLENKPYVAYSIKDNGVVYTIVPKKDEEGMYTIYRVVKKDISGLEYNAVDLGLPSGPLWADRNVGATSPEHYGSYFQWGDTEAFTYDGVGEITAAKLAEVLQRLVGDEMEVTADNVHEILTLMMGADPGYDMSILGFRASIGKEFNWDSYFDTKDDGSTFNKYSNEKGKLKVLESTDDAATVHMGSEWRMPTMVEIQELIDNTTPTFIDLQGNEYSKEETQNGAISEGNFKGIRLTGSNGNSIFIAAAGYCYETVLYDVGDGGCLWSSRLNEDFSMSGRNLDFNYGGYLDDGVYNRYYGRSVRGVKA